MPDRALTTPQSGLYCAPLAAPAATRRGPSGCGPSIRLTYTLRPFSQAKRSGGLFKSLAGNFCGDSRLEPLAKKPRDQNVQQRSEERRGGKEGRARGSPYHLKKKKRR